MKTSTMVAMAVLVLAGCDGGGGSAEAGGPDALATHDAAGEVLDGAPEAGPRPPQPAEPCGTDLEADNGAVVPDLGTVPAGAPFSGDPAAPGPHGVSSEDLTIPNPDTLRPELAVTVYTPLDVTETPLEGPLPLVLVLPGFTSSHTQYAAFSEHLASHGFGVVGMTPALWTFDDPQDHPATTGEVLALLDWALASSSLGDRIDATKVAVAGHSAGGKMAFYAATLDARIDLVIGWDPQNGGGPPCDIAASIGEECNLWPVAPNCEVEDAGRLHLMHAETLVFAARDALFTPDEHTWAEQFYRGAPSPAHLVLFPAASHIDWMRDEAVAEVTRRAHTALLLARFMGRAGLDDLLPGGSDWASEDSVTVHTK